MSEPHYEVTINTAPDGSDVTFQFIFNSTGCHLTVHTPENSWRNYVDVEDLKAFQDACYAMRELLQGVR